MKVHKKSRGDAEYQGSGRNLHEQELLGPLSITPPSLGGDQYPDGLLTPVEEALIKTERWMYDHFLAHRSRILEYVHRSVYWLHNSTTRRFGIKVAEGKRLLDAGNWYGNDSAWRMAVDLFRVFVFTDRDGHLQKTPQRRMFHLLMGSLVVRGMAR